ncbi:unnamed protein product [Sphenostylis stenocarpa]|uniref:TF-B3 domain-containing protein n=1 Tax=Sphenostylis stenocarpa TaxID=92480 RepID=A0AA86TJU3_9FABA|nr:unnamed protein product [Sphenostylis stenocarpa]
MEVEICMNGACKNGSGREWKKGWPLRSGGFAKLCDKCGSVYANSIFCEKFHLHQTGWRECEFCNKSIHCGCIVSRFTFEYLDFGGIGCTTCCVKASQLPSMQETGNSIRSVRSIKNSAGDSHTEHIDDRLFNDGSSKGKLMHMRRIVDGGESSHKPQAERGDIDSCIGRNREDIRFSNVMKPSNHSSKFTTLEDNGPTWGTRSLQRSSPLNISRGASSGKSVLPSGLEIVEGRFEGKSSSSSCHQGQRPVSILPKPMNGITMNMETSHGMNSHDRVARPPADGKGKNMLLSRYWPRITDQELEQLSGDLKSTIVPLFEKVLSASDAGRIGRLVLPKSCAEIPNYEHEFQAYFPPISQSEGLPLEMRDVKGNEWTFQFRFWPNNNSRMYVLEGVTPCMQTLQLNAGDTEKEEVRADYWAEMQRALIHHFLDASTTSNVFSTKETTFSGASANIQSGNSYCDLLQTRRGNGEPSLNGSERFRLGTGIADYHKTENFEMANNDLVQQPSLVSEKNQNIGHVSKRSLIHNDDVMELRVTWKEAQDLLCPAPSVKPSIVTIEDQEFEEYEVSVSDTVMVVHLVIVVLCYFKEPPVFGKTTSTNAHSSGSSSFASKEMSPKDLESILVTIREVLDDDLVDPTYSSAGATAKHSRHRSGCTCIVCIQPPRGRGRHRTACACPTCVMYKKQRQSKQEANATQKDHIYHGDQGGGASLMEKEGSINKSCLKVGEIRAGQIDLNSLPSHDDDMQVDV